MIDDEMNNNDKFSFVEVKKNQYIKFSISNNKIINEGKIFLVPIGYSLFDFLIKRQLEYLPSEILNKYKL